LKTKNVLK